jgi:signal transduction histidine kinase
MDDQFGAVVSRLDAEQGLPSQNTFAVLPMRANGNDETLLIGTNRGVARYVPSRAAPVLMPIRIIGQRIHQLEEMRTGINLDYPQNTLVLDVAATSSRTFPEQFQYAFLLYDGAGKLVKQKLSHDAQFTMESLKAGKYKVVARAFSKDLIASAPLSFEFNVAGAPFPRTTVALSVLLALALVALWFGYYQNRRLARTGAALKDTNRQLTDARLQLANETETERRRIARDLHDQTLADLRHLLMLTDQLPANGHEAGEQSKAVAPAVFRNEIESISNEIRRICEDLSPSVLENVGFSAALEWALANAVTHAPVERKFEYEFTADENLDEQLNLPRATEMQIYRILQEAVSNISRHAAAKRVRLTATTSPAGDFLLTLEDDGRDFDPHDRKLKQGRGLANIRARASLIEAEVNWSKREGGGTQFTLRKANAVKDSGVQT